MGRGDRGTWVLCALFALAAITTPAHGQDASAEASTTSALLGEARSGLDRADFAAVDQALDRTAMLTMTHDELVLWLTLRVLVAYADERLGALEEGLAALASVVAPGEALAEPLPGPVQRRFDELRTRDDAGITLDAQLAVVDEPGAPRRTVGVAATLTRDPGHLVRRTVVRMSVDGGPLHEVAPGSRLELPGDQGTDAVVTYAVTALGPGDAVIATLGSDEAPRTEEVPGVPADDTALIVGLAVPGAMLVVAGVLTLALVGAGVIHGPTDTMLETPSAMPLLRF